MNLRETPFLRILLPFLLGIILSQHLPLDASSYFLLFAFVLLTCLVFHLALKELQFQLLKGICFNVLYVLIGLGFATGKDLPESITASQKGLHFLEVYETQRKASKLKVKAKLKARLDVEQKIQPSSGNVIFYLPQEELHPHLGDLLLCKGSIRNIEGPKNPFAFDYKKFCAAEGILGNMYVEKYELLDQGEYFVQGLIQGIRNHLGECLEKHIHSLEELSIAKAILLGDKSLLSAELRANFADTGAMHVLAVSGLHVGLISFFLLKLLNLIRSKKWWVRFGKAFMLISLIWTYAFVCGASPSVIRAACMFSLMFLGIQLFKKGNVFNTIAFSAFLLLMFDPLLIYDLSFQLSYAALIGIVYFQHKIYILWITQNPLLDWVWKLTSVSIAAQVTTLPISLYYFHQFPLFFWLSGLVVIPSATLILLLGLILFFCEATSIGGSIYLGRLLEWVLFINNKIIAWISEIPMTKLNFISIQPHELMLSYVFIFLIMLSIELKKGLLFKWAGIVFLLLIISLNLQLKQHFDEEQLCIYHNKKGILIDYFKDRTVFTLQHGLDGSDIDFTAKGLRSQHKVKSTIPLAEAKEEALYRNGLLLVKDKSLLLLNEYVPEKDLLKVDMLLLSEDVPFDYEKIARQVAFQKIILAASNSNKYIKNLKAQCKEKQVEIYDLKEKGAYLMGL